MAKLIRAFLIFLLIPSAGVTSENKQTIRKPGWTRQCDAKAFGAVGDGNTKDTKAIQDAIDECAKTGGTVDLMDGVFLSGMIVLKSNVELRIEPNATLKGSQDESDYPDTQTPSINSQLSNCRKTLIYAENASQLIIDGAGTIDGSGGNPNWKGKEATRPMGIFLTLSSNITIKNIQLKNAGMWGIVNFESDHIEINHVKIDSTLGPTRDGIDIVDCHHVMIENCTISSEDDSICLKSGSLRGVFDVTVKNCHVLNSSVANGLKLGTASTGSFKKILFQDIKIDHVAKAAMAIESVDGAEISEIQFQNIQFDKAGSAVFILLGKRGNPTQVGSVKNIFFNNISGGVQHTWGSAVSGTTLGKTTYKIKNLIFKNFKIKNFEKLDTIPKDPPEYAGQYPDPNLWENLPASGFYLRHIDGLSFVQTEALPAAGEARPPIKQVDVQNISIH